MVSGGTTSSPTHTVMTTRKVDMFTNDELIFVEAVINEKLERINNMDRVEPWTKGESIYEMRVNLETALEKVRKM